MINRQLADITKFIKFGSLFILLLLTSCASIGRLSLGSKPSLGQSQFYSSLQNYGKLSDGEKRRLSRKIDKDIAAGKKAGTKELLSMADGLFLKANDASMSGNSHLAEFLFEKLLQITPHDNFVKRKYAVELIRVGKLDRAKAVLEPIFKADYKGNEVSGLILAGIYTALNDGKQANRVYRTILKHHPKSEEACVLLAKSYVAEGKHTKADKLLISCEKRNRKSAAFSYYRGKLAIQRNKYKVAHRLFSRAVRIDPNYYQAVIDKGLLLARDGRIKRAINIYKRFLKKNPHNHQVLSKIVELMFVAHRYREVIPYAERLSSMDSGNVNLKVKLGIIYVNSQRYKDAIGLFEEVLSIVPDSYKVKYYLGSLYKKDGRGDKAIKYFSGVPPESQLFSDSTLQIAEILQSRTRDTKHHKHRERVDKFVSFVSERGKKFAKVRVDMAVILSAYYEESGDFNKAKDAIVKARGGRGYSDRHEYYLASLYDKLSKPKKAEKIVKGILERNPNNATALNYLGYTMLERGDDYEVAYSYIKRAVEIRPNDGHIIDSLGWYYYKVGRYKDALREFKKAWGLVKSDVAITKHLALTYVALKRYKQAEKYYLKALKLCRHEREKEEILRAIDRFKSRRIPTAK